MAAVAVQVNNARFSFLVFEFDLVAHQSDGLAHRRISRVGGDDSQPHDGPLGAADEADGLRERHIDNVHGWFPVLGDRHDPVADLEEFAAGGRTARHEFANFAVAILGLERGADADERQVHRDGKILGLPPAHIIRMRVVSVGERGEVDLQHLVLLPLLHRVKGPLVTAGKGLDDFVGLLVAKLLLQVFVAQLLAPEVFGLSEVTRAGRILPIPPVAVIPREIEGFCL